MTSRGAVNYDPYTPGQQYEIQQISDAFLSNTLEEIADISSMR